MRVAGHCQELDGEAAQPHESVYTHFNLRRLLCSRDNLKLNHAAALAQWRQLGAA